MDVLEKAPGVTLDKDDNISLKGKQGVTVMIDGKPTYLSATQLADYLRSLPASAIDQIELMTNPSAKYDAAGNSGIINIKTKKNKMKGFNGNINLTHIAGCLSETQREPQFELPNGTVQFLSERRLFPLGRLPGVADPAEIYGCRRGADGQLDLPADDRHAFYQPGRQCEVWDGLLYDAEDDGWLCRQRVPEHRNGSLGQQYPAVEPQLCGRLAGLFTQYQQNFLEERFGEPEFPAYL